MVDSNEQRMEVLTTQYEQAVTLYQHEDSLNWQKVNHALVVNGGILAALQFAEKGTAFMALLAAAAAGASAIFLITLWNGYRYVGLRKAAVKRAEEELAQIGGLKDFLAVDRPLFGCLTTGIAMRLLLVAFIVLWIYIAWTSFASSV